MTTAVQHRRGTTAEHAAFTGLEGELTIDTTKDTAVIHDGTLAGGYPLAKENLANVNTSGLSSIDGASTASDDKFFIYDQSATSLKTITRAELNNAIEQDALANVAITGGTINGTTIGGTTAAAGAFTTLAASGAVTLSGATANGVVYANDSKVLTTGSALTFDGTRLTSTTGKFGGGAASNSASLMVNNATNTATGIQLFQDGIESWIMGMPANSAGLAWSASGTEQMRLTSTGLGIGTSSPTEALTITNDNTYKLSLKRTADGSYAAFGATGNSLLIYNNGAERMRLDASGNLGIGTSSPGAKLQVESTTPTTNIKVVSSPSPSLIYSGFEAARTGVSAGALMRSFRDGAVGGVGWEWLTTVDNSGEIAGTYTSRMILDRSGNLGLGVTPSAWNTSFYKALQVGAGASLFASPSNGAAAWLSANAFFNSSNNNTYITTAAATQYRQLNGEHSWLTAPSGTAGNAITFTQALSLTAAGNLLLGGTTDPGGTKVLYIGNGTTPGTPTSGGVLYVESGALKYKGSSGTVTTLGAA